jgi:AcrR family transcriptional regulator
MTIQEPSRRERKKDETRRRIFEAAISLFREKGFEATTVDEITEKADVGRGTFFNYFPRKEAIFAYMAEEQVAAMAEVLPGMLGSDDTSLEILVRVMQLAGESYSRDKEVSQMVFAEWIKHDVAPPADAKAHASRFMHDLFERARARGEIAADLDFVRASAIVRGTFLATLFQWLYCEPGCPEEITDLHDELEARMRLAFSGLAARQEMRP